MRMRARSSDSALMRAASSDMPVWRPVRARISISSVSILRRARFLTRVTSAISSTGLVRKSSAPPSSPRTLSETWSSAVTRTTGTWWVFGLALMRRQVSKPSISGIMTSSSTTSTRSRSQISSASLPLPAVSTSKYSAERRASSSFTFAGMSSTTRTRAVIFATTQPQLNSTDDATCSSAWIADKAMHGLRKPLTDIGLEM